VAHNSALENNGRTIAIQGCGMDRIYPPEHRRLAEQIKHHGVVLSEFPPGTPPEASNFPARNRIISGLSRAVIVVEAGKRSGALITASFAADQGRDVFAVPGQINSPKSIGTNQLIQKGAAPFIDIQDVILSLGIDLIHEKRHARSELPGNEIESSLFELLTSDPMHIDEICENSSISVDKVSSALVLLELKGLVMHVGNMRYVSLKESSSGYLGEK
jgi:DNA processing protein